MKGDTYMLARLRKVTKDDQGASAVEYGLLVAAVAAIIVVVVFALGNIVNEVFTNTCDTIAGQAGPVAITSTCPGAAPTGG